MTIISRGSLKSPRCVKLIKINRGAAAKMQSGTPMAICVAAFLRAARN
ncbi:hypothetical protein AAULH_01432 [Lactobacillus helveticus MTCC 5463]|nr:hypothetical protein AAULH_01432 [Lactobacillus helveticus MTCC 5463]